MGLYAIALAVQVDDELVKQGLPGQDLGSRIGAGRGCGKTQ